MHEHPAVAFQLLQDETFAPKQAGEDFLLELDTDGDAFGAGQETVFLTDQLAAEITQVERQDRAGVGRCKRHAALTRTLLRKHRGEQALAGQHALACTEQRTQQPGRLIAAVAEDGFHLHVAGLVHHRPGFGDGAFARVKLQFDELGFRAVELEVHPIGGLRQAIAARGVRFGRKRRASGGHRGRRGCRGCLRWQPGRLGLNHVRRRIRKRRHTVLLHGAHLRHLIDRLPVRHALLPAPGTGRLTGNQPRSIRVHRAELLARVHHKPLFQGVYSRANSDSWLCAMRQRLRRMDRSTAFTSLVIAPMEM
ncbi:Transcriptional regulator [Pseudomonas syringae pv. aptata]|uniref:Transcriptional regulator n=1 Tax=Pseudomonas syringae pv. aptata TaxID=83167 RepID=A0A3M3XIR7_PSEAP|nr:Transcriptional regulator [Pseudomonas syringae pv. aptata]